MKVKLLKKNFLDFARLTMACAHNLLSDNTRTLIRMYPCFYKTMIDTLILFSIHVMILKYIFVFSQILFCLYSYLVICAFRMHMPVGISIDCLILCSPIEFLFFLFYFILFFIFIFYTEKFKILKFRN